MASDWDTIVVHGNYGTLHCHSITGDVVHYEWEHSDAKGPDDPDGYGDVASVDLAERAAWYAGRGVTLPARQPDGDILDFTLVRKDGTRCPAESDFREGIAMEHYGAAPAGQEPPANGSPDVLEDVFSAGREG